MKSKEDVKAKPKLTVDPLPFDKRAASTWMLDEESSFQRFAEESSGEEDSARKTLLSALVENS